MTNKKSADVVLRVAVVDDDADLRHYFHDVLKPAEGFELVAEFSNAAEALRGIPHLKLDLVAMDIRMPGLNGIQCTERLKIAMPHLKIVILTGSHNEDAVNSSLRVGADAYLIKPVTGDQWLATLRFVCAGRIRSRPDPLEPTQESAPAVPLEIRLSLSPQENAVLKGLAAGLLYKEISDKLGISYATVHKYQHNIFQKLHVSNRSEAIRLWLAGGQG